jgi:hypothetical protein
LDEPKIIDSEAGIPQESARCAFRNLRVIGNNQFLHSALLPLAVRLAAAECLNKP